jgi:ferredoxin
MIFYFSGTGNTRWAAQRLAEATGEQLVSMADALRQQDLSYGLADGERLGFCFPIHGWQPPHIVRTFIDRLTIKTAGSPYCYTVCSCGDSTGLAVDMLAKELKAKGWRLSASLSLIMPESYVCLPFMYTDTPERERRKLQQAEHDLDQFIPVVTSCQEGVHRLRKGLTPWLFSHVIGAYFNRRMITDRKFRVNADKCVGCKRCEQVCPTGNLNIIDGKPQWRHDSSCTCCLACYHHCPNHAIDYGRYTPRRGQYFYGHR